MKYVNLKATVVRTPKPKMVYTRWGTGAYVANTLITDETGTIRLCLWNEHIDKVSEGDVIKIENFQVSRFKGVPYLRKRRQGEIGVLQRSIDIPTERKACQCQDGLLEIKMEVIKHEYARSRRGSESLD